MLRASIVSTDYIAVAASSERQRWTDTVGVDDSLSRDLVTTTVSVLTDREWLAHAAPPRTPASRSTGNGDAQESEQGVLAVEFRDDSRCKKSRHKFSRRARALCFLVHFKWNPYPLVISSILTPTEFHTFKVINLVTQRMVGGVDVTD